MTKVLAGGILLVLLAEGVAFAVARRWAVPVTGAAVALFALELRSRFVGVRDDGDEQTPTDDALEALLRWRSQTETLIRWADSTRADWDRHLRPRLAREFVLATRQKESAALAATGLMVFGARLWPWVDPQNVAAGPAAGREPGPGREVLDEILQRLEQT